MSADRDVHSSPTDDDKLVRPKAEFCSLLRHAGATKDVFTMKEVMFYLGQYIIQKQLYDQKQQHIVHCSQDALGRVLGVDSFSVKEPRILFAMITKNLAVVRDEGETDGGLTRPLPASCPALSHTSNPTPLPASCPALSHTSNPTLCFSELPSSRGEAQSGGSQTDARAEEAPPESHASPGRRRNRRRRRRSCRSSDPGPSHCENYEDDEEEEVEERKRRRSESYSLTFDDTVSWCVIGGLGHSSQSSDSHSVSERSEVAAPALDSDSDNFSVEFEVESIDSDDYNEDDASLSTDDQMYEVTIFEADDDDSFDEDTEITEADYWRCLNCDELNPPLPRNCLRCWTLRQDWLPADSGDPAPSSPKALPLKPAAKEASGSEVEDNDGVDVPDGKRPKSPLPLLNSLDSSSSSAPNSQDVLPDSQPSSSCSSQEKFWTPDSQPSSSSTVDSQKLVPSPPPSALPPLERTVSAECRLPDSCLDPCLICQSRPKNGCIVHGRTGHLMSCYVCARKLKKRNKLCPVCRMPIQSVIFTYLS